RRSRRRRRVGFSPPDRLSAAGGGCCTKLARAGVGELEWGVPGARRPGVSGSRAQELVGKTVDGLRLGSGGSFAVATTSARSHGPAAPRRITRRTGETAMTKTVCPITRREFAESAKDVDVTIAGVPVQALVKQFSTGSIGWFLNGKVTIEVGGKRVTVQVGLNLTIVGSKELPKEVAEAA